jgi:hypothetical protein
MNVSYKYITGQGHSEFSAIVSFYCASTPSEPSLPIVWWKDINRIIINWNQPMSGGSPILGYVLMMKLATESDYITIYDGSQSPSVTYATISKYKNNPLTTTSYMFQLFAMNLVGTSGASPVLTVTISNTASATTSILSGEFLNPFPANRLVDINIQLLFINIGQRLLWSSYDSWWIIFYTRFKRLL